MIPTDTDALSALFAPAIANIVPKSIFKGGEKWKPHSRETAAITQTRRFRLEWTGEGDLQPRGAMCGDIHEHWAVLRVVTEYVGDHARQQHIVIEDYHQVCETLTNLKASSEENGLVLVERLRCDGANAADVLEVFHTYRVRYMRRVQL